MAQAAAKPSPQEAEYLHRLNRSYVPKDKQVEDKIHEGAGVYEYRGDRFRHIDLNALEDLGYGSRRVGVGRRAVGKGARGAAQAAHLFGRHGLGEALELGGDVASGAAMDPAARSGLLRRSAARVGAEAAKHYAKKGVNVKGKTYQTSAGKAAMLAGAVSGLIKGKGVKGIAVTALNYYIWWLAFGALWTIKGYIPGLLYLDFHYIMSKIAPDLFLPLYFERKFLLIAANLIAIMAVGLAITLVISLNYAVCQGGIAGYAVRGLALLSGNLYTAFSNEHCEAFNGLVESARTLPTASGAAVSGEIIYNEQTKCIEINKPRYSNQCQ